MEEITSDIFVSDQSVAAALLQGEAHHCRSILNLRPHTEDGFLPLDAQCSAKGIRLINAPMDSATCSVDDLRAAVGVLDLAEKPCLIYCRTGGRAKMLAVAHAAVYRAARPEEHPMFASLPERFRGLLQQMTATPDAAGAAAIEQIALAGTPVVQCFFEGETCTAQFVVHDPETKVAAIIDSVMNFDAAAGRTSYKDANKLLEYLRTNDLKLEYILETHVHADHLTASAYLKSQFPEAKTAIGFDVTKVQTTFAKLFNLKDFKCDGSQFDRLFKDGERFTLGKIECIALHTPGHTPACMCYVMGDAVFTGDTIFMPDMGTARCDFPGGSAAQLFASVQKIFRLKDTTRVFVGHDYAPDGRPYAWESTIADEKAKNKSLSQCTMQDKFIEWRSARDATLGPPKLILPSLQINLRAGNLPESEDNGVAYLKLPLNLL